MTDRPFRGSITDHSYAPTPVDGRRDDAPSAASEEVNPRPLTVLVVGASPDSRPDPSFTAHGVIGSTGKLVAAPTLDQAIAQLSHARDIDLVLYDVSAPSSDRVASIVRHAGRRPVVVFAASGAPADIRAAAKVGAAGYVIKTQANAVLRHALRLALSGCGYFPADLLLADAAPAAGARTGAPMGNRDRELTVPWTAKADLSAVELDILALLLDGLPNRAIAERLKLDEGTVKIRLKALFRRIGVQNRTQAAVYAIHHLGKRPRRPGCRT